MLLHENNDDKAIKYITISHISVFSGTLSCNNRNYFADNVLYDYV